MTKELVVSASNYDTKIAIQEDGQVVEVYFEREKEYSLAGSIYKGRVTRILPGMQSAFVNIGLERDAFLYVSDFLEQLEEYERVSTPSRERPKERSRPASGERPGQHAEERQSPVVAEPAAEPAASVPFIPSIEQPAPPEVETATPPVRPDAGVPAAEPGEDNRGRSRRFSRRSRRQRGRHRELPESKYARQGPLPQDPPRATPPAAEAVSERVLLPGESLAKYKGAAPTSQPETNSPNLESAASAAEETAAPAEQISETVVPIGIVETPSPEPAELVDEIRFSTVHTTVEPEASVPGFLAVEEAIQAAREEKMIEELEEEAVEIAESEAADFALPTVPREEARSWDSWDVQEPTGEGAEGAQERGALEEEELEPPAMAPELESEAIAAEAEGTSTPRARNDGGVEGGEAVRGASVRERPGHPRYQRRGRWGARRPARGPARGDDPRRGARTWDREREAPKPLIADMLKEGQEIIVQIAKEPLGKKGARITSHIALPGRYIVYMPTLDHVGVSRKIESDEERHRLKRIIVDCTRNLSGGFIVRTAGEGQTEEDLRQDVQFLVKLWADIKAKAEKATAPALLHHDLDLTLRTLRDQLSDEFQTIWVDNEQAYEQIVSLVQKFQPSLAPRVRLYTKDVPLFEETGVQEEINKALKPKVWLKSGGYIVINQTEALVAIDVNTGKFVGKSNRLEDTIVKTNVEAIQEIVRQIRLRDLGGIIVIDFIDMDERRNRQKVMSELEAALRTDKSPSKILAFNEFGLIAITRKRVRQSLERTLCQPCAYCSGAGLVKTPATVCLEILTEAKKMASELHGKQVTLRVNPDVGKALKSRDSGVLMALEEITGRGIIIRSDPAVHAENFYFD